MTVDIGDANSTVRESQGLATFLEGGTLVLATAACYATAFAFEQGYADHFGYPYALIELSLTTLLLTGLGLATAVFLGYHLVLTALAVTPARHAKILVFNFFNFYLAISGCLFYLAASSYLDGAPDWFRLVLLLCGGLFLMFILLRLTHFWPRGDTQASGFLTKYGQASRRVIEEHLQSTDSGNSLYDLARRDVRWSGATTRLYVTLLTGSLAFGAANVVGRLAARQQSDFLIHEGGPTTLIVVRRYSDYLVTARFNRPTRTVLPIFVIVPLIDSSASWAMTHLSSYQVLPPR